MTRNSIFALFLAWQAVQLIPLINADSVLDLGNTDQYDAKTPPPFLAGKTVWMSSKGGTDITMALSPDMQAQVKDTLGKCQGRDNACFQALTSLMHSSDIEIDGGIENRGFAQLLSKTFKSIGAEFTLFAGILIAMWQAKQDPQPKLDIMWQFPGDRASQAASVANGVPLTLSAGGSPVAVVTPTAPPSSVTGSVTPGVTSISNATSGWQPGDYVITLDPNLASGLDEIVKRFTQCEEGSKLDSESAKRAGNPYSGAVCGAIGGLTQAARGGPAHDFALIGAPQIPFTGREITAAAQAVINFAIDYAPLLEVTPESAAAMATIMLALAINALNNKHVIAATNVIHPDGTITSSPSSTSTSSCTTCVASCSEVGAMFFSCETSCNPATVCPTSTSFNGVATTTTKAYDGPATVKATPTSTSAPIPSCAMDKPAVVPGSIFAGSKYNVVDHFCDEVAKKPEGKLNWIVDINGNQIQPKRRAVEARSPPVTPDTYKDYKVALSWAPNLHPAFNAGDCLKGCKDAFQYIAGGPCGSTGGDQNVMAGNGVWDVTCGAYGWSIIKPSGTDPPPGPSHVPLAVGSQTCFTESNFPGHADVDAQDVSNGAAIACGQVPRAMSAQSPRWTPPKQLYGRNGGGNKLNFAVEWKTGCVTDAEEINVRDPLGRDNNLCYFLLFQDWKNCNNGGVGGWIEVGCLSYEFQPGKT